MLKETVAQGYGRHSKEECIVFIFFHKKKIYLTIKCFDMWIYYIKVFQIGKEDIIAFENFIGTKKYLMGDRVCNEDASLFGLLAQLVNHDKSQINKFFISKILKIKRIRYFYLNIIDFCNF